MNITTGVKQNKASVKDNRTTKSSISLASEEDGSQVISDEMEITEEDMRK